MADDRPELLLPDAAAWRAWLLAHHSSVAGVWLVLHKKGEDVTTLTYADALDEALCFGWIDGQTRRRDAASTLQRMTPRRPRSPWSARNVGHIERLEREGRMHDAGRAQVRAAQADGRWDRAYGGQADAVVPDDLAAAVASEPRAQAWFDVLTSTNRYAILHRVADAKRPETRARRIADFVDKLTRDETPYPQKRRLAQAPARAVASAGTASRPESACRRSRRSAGPASRAAWRPRPGGGSRTCWSRSARRTRPGRAVPRRPRQPGRPARRRRPDPRRHGPSGRPPGRREPERARRRASGPRVPGARCGRRCAPTRGCGAGAVSSAGGCSRRRAGGSGRRSNRSRAPRRVRLRRSGW